MESHHLLAHSIFHSHSIFRMQILTFQSLAPYLLKPLFLHGSTFHSLTLVSMSHSYETVASILGPSSFTLAEVDHQPKAVSSMDPKNKKSNPPDEPFPQYVDNTNPTQKTEDQFEDSHDSEYPTSVEPYMWDLVDDQSAFPSPDTDDQFSVCASMKKWPPLTEADITEISKDDSEPVEEQDTTLDTKQRSVTGQDSVQTSVYIETLLETTETEHDEVKTGSPSSQLDKG